MKREMECGCEILVYEDGSAQPEIVYCRPHAAAETMKKALIDLKVKIESRAREHQCMGFHCSQCAPAELAEMAGDALHMAGEE